MLRLALTTFASFSLLAVGCASAADSSGTSSTGSSTADYSSFAMIATDTYLCSITDGHTTTTATLTRDLLQKKVTPSDRLFVEELHVAEPVFTKALATFGAYGCAHDSQGLDWTSRDDSAPPTALPAAIDFSYDAGLQWTNCDYDGTESATVKTTADGIVATVGMTKGSASVAFSGPCAKQN